MNHSTKPTVHRLRPAGSRRGTLADHSRTEAAQCALGRAARAGQAELRCSRGRAEPLAAIEGPVVPAPHSADVMIIMH